MPHGPFGRDEARSNFTTHRRAVLVSIRLTDSQSAGHFEKSFARLLLGPKADVEKLLPLRLKPGGAKLLHHFAPIFPTKMHWDAGAISTFRPAL